MDAEEALRVADAAVFAKTKEHLTDIQRSILLGSWQGQNYDEIAETCYREAQHVKNIGSAFWKLLSDALGEKVTKRNFRAALERRSHSAAVSQPQEQAQEETVSKNTDFVGREDASTDSTSENKLDELVRKVRSHFGKEIQNQCKNLCTFDLSYTPCLRDIIHIDVKLKEYKPFTTAEAPQEPQLWKEVVLNNPKLMVLGKPGAGKTSLLKYIAVRCNDVDFPTKPVPVFVSIKKSSESKLGLLDYIIKKYCHPKVSEEEFKNLLSYGKFLFLLDGLDEVLEECRCNLLREIYNLLDNFEKNLFIITCRKEFHAYKSTQFGNFSWFEVTNFDQHQIRDFIKAWFAEVQGLIGSEQLNEAANLISKLELRENRRIQELADTPLLLHLICLIFLDKKDFPSNRSTLYSEVITLLLSKWNQFNERPQGVDLNLLRKMLNHIAAITFEQGDASFEERKIQRLLANCPFTLSDIQVQYGLLTWQGLQTYAFSNQTFQEHLTAEVFANSNPPDLEKLVNYITDQRWHQVFLLAVGLMHPADELLHQMKKKIDDIVLDGILQEFLKWTNRRACKVQQESERQYKLAAIRAYYLSIAYESYIDVVLANSLESEVKSHPSILLDLALAKTLWCFYFFQEGNYSAMSNIAHWLAKALHRLDSADLNLQQLCKEELEGKLRELIEELPVELKQRLLSNIAILNHLDANKKFCLEQVQQEPKSIQQFKEQTHNPDGDGVRFSEWWSTKSQTWAEKLRKVMIEYRDIGQKWPFSPQQQQALYQYHHANRLLVECLNSGCDVSREVRQEIENALFLPIKEN